MSLTYHVCMRFLFTLFIMLPWLSFADTSVRCELTTGIYENSRAEITDLRFETVTDIFSLTNARTLVFNFDGNELRLLRSDMKVSKYTQMVFHQRKNDIITRTAIVMIDRTPKQIMEDGEFNGNMIVSGAIADKPMWLQDHKVRKYTYNFKCRI